MIGPIGRLGAAVVAFAGLSSADAQTLKATAPPLARPVAPVVSPSWGDARQRDRAGEVFQIARRLGLKPGDAVADIGAGEGYDTVRLSRLVGPRGAVFAEDITPDYLVRLRAAVKALGLANVKVIQGEPGDPRLPPRSIDAAVMIHMYHEISAPYALLGRLARAFRPDGRLLVEDLDRPTAAHGTPPRLLTCELAQAGYRLVSLAPLTGGLGYAAVFAPPRPGARPPQVGACRS